MYCKNCGNLINQDGKFCANCGAVIDENEQEKTNLKTLNQENNIEVNNVENNESSVEIKKSELSESTDVETQNINKEIEQTINNNLNQQPKKQKKSNVGMVIVILLLLVLIGSVVFYFINQKNNDDNKSDNETQVTDKNDENNDTNDNKENEDGNDKKEDNDNQTVVEDNFMLPDGFVLSSNMKNIIDSYNPITTTKATLDMTGYNIIYEINMTNELIVSCSDNSCETKVLDLNGEKAKYVGSVSNGIANLYNTKVLTEEGSIYDISYSEQYKSFDVEIISSTESFVGFALVPFNYKDSSYEHITNGLGSKNSTAYGITEEGIYISLDIPSQEPKPAIIYLDFAPDEGEEYFTTDLAYIYEDASLRYIDVLRFKQEYQECVSEKLKKYPDADYPTKEDSYECFSKFINVESYVVDENNKKMHAQLVFIDKDNNLYFISFGNKIYKLTKEKKDNNYIAKLYNNSKIKNIVTTGDYKESYGWFSSITLEYEDGKSETFEIYNNGSRSSQIIYEKES